jgi:hypothetical protein
MKTDEYTDKVNSFLTENNFQKLTKHLPKTMQQCNLIIDKKHIKYLTQKKPLPPNLKAQIKLHKPGNLIRPVINNTKAPSYKLAKHLVQVMNRHLHLSKHYNVKNSVALADKLTKLTIKKHHRMIT